MVYINGRGHMTKMAAMQIHGKNLSKYSAPEPEFIYDEKFRSFKSEEKIFIRKKLGHTAVSAIKASSVTR